LTGSSSIVCNNGGSWSVTGSCGGVTAAPATNPPATTNAPATTKTTTTTTAPSTPSPTASSCWSGLLSNTYLSSYPTGYTAVNVSLALAQATCLTLYDCGGVTQAAPGGGWQCRKGTNAITSGSGENSYLRKTSCGTTVASPTTTAPATTSAPSPSSSKSTSTITFGNGFIFSQNLNSYVLGPKQKSLNFFITPTILTDSVPTGSFTLKDTMTNSYLTMSGTLQTGKIAFTFNYGAAKTGLHTWVMTYTGDQNFAPSTRTISVIFYNGLASGHYVISQSVAAVGRTAYFFGPNWEQNNNAAINFNGLVLDTTTAACGNVFTGLQSNSSNSMGPYLGAYVVSSLTQAQTNTQNQAIMGAIAKVAIIRMNTNSPTTVGLSNPGTGTIVEIYCPNNF